MDEWQSNVRIVQCTDGTWVRPCPRCAHHFGEHNLVGDCLVCVREGQRCGVQMHVTWPHLIPFDLQTA